LQAVILAGGLGTRLGSLLRDLPKPMAPVAGRPVLEHQIEALRNQGVGEVILCVGHLSVAIEQHLGDGERLGVRIRYAREERPLGTAGAIRNAARHIAAEPFLAMNGDTLVPDADYRALLRSHAQRASASPETLATLLVTHPPDPGAYGVIDLDETSGRVLRFREKAPVDPATAWISAGVYVLDPSLLDRIPADRPVSIEFDVFPRLLEEGRTVWGQVYDGFFGDMGTPEGYRRVDEYMRLEQEGEPT